MSKANTIEELREMLKRFTRGPEQVMPAKVLSVDLNAMTCEVEPIEQASIPDVRLKSGIDEVTDGIVEIPEENSFVLIGIIGNDPNTAYVVKCSKVSKVIINGGSNEGLIIWSKLKADLMKIKQYLIALDTAIKVVQLTNVPTQPDIFQGTLITALASQTLPDFNDNDILNDKVVH